MLLFSNNFYSDQSTWFACDILNLQKINITILLRVSNNFFTTKIKFFNILSENNFNLIFFIDNEIIFFFVLKWFRQRLVY